MDRAPARAVSDLRLYDDGEYYIERHIVCGKEHPTGFLHKRCSVSLMAPGGYDVVGMYEGKPGRVWTATIDAEYSAERDSDKMNLGNFTSLEAAAAALWERRHEALCQHR